MYPIQLEPCLLCSAHKWELLPNPHATQSVRTDGAVVLQALNKFQCLACGLVKRFPPQDIDLTELYTADYNLYMHRPQAEHFIGSRYQQLAGMIRDTIYPLQPGRILEVGCGHGGTLRALQQVFPEAELYGIEPVPQAAKQASILPGLTIFSGMLHEVSRSYDLGTFDLVISIHVIEHVEHPQVFLNQLKSYVNAEGCLFVSCPNGALPSAELMRADHLYSFTPEHLAELCNRVQLEISTAGIFYDTSSPEQYVVGRYPENIIQSKQRKFNTPVLLCRERQSYFKQWQELDQKLIDRFKSYQNVYCFGAGGFTALPAAYAPHTWSLFKGCLIDDETTASFHGKTIFSMKDWSQLLPDALLIGTNPYIQPKIAERLRDRNIPLIRWDDLIQR